MSLYHYIGGKDDLAALMDDALMAETIVPEEELPADWREAVMAIARRIRALSLRHRWALAALQAGEMERRRGTDPAIAQAALEYARELLRSGRYPFIEALSRDPSVQAGGVLLDERHFDEQFEHGLRLLIDGSCPAPPEQER